MPEAKKGDTIRVHYTGKLEDGTVFDSSQGGDPLEFTIGSRQVIPGFEEATVGLVPGESKTVNVPYTEAYGPHKSERVFQLERKRFPQNIHPEIGKRLQLIQPDQEPVAVTVTDVSKSRVTLDANHPLAGKDLSFEIKLVEIL